MEDANPYRRNYLLCSVGMILYFAGGGHLLVSDSNDASIAIGIINIGLSRPWVLAWAAFLTWAWCCYRYIQKCPDPMLQQRFDFFVSANKNLRLLEILDDWVKSGNRERDYLVGGESFRYKVYFDKIAVFGPFRDRKLNEERYEYTRSAQPVGFIDLTQEQFAEIRPQVRASVFIDQSGTADWWVPHWIAIAAVWSVFFLGVPWHGIFSAAIDLFWWILFFLSF